MVKQAVHQYWSRRAHLRDGLTAAEFSAGLFNISHTYDGDWEMEGYMSADGQRDKSMTWEWGHDFVFPLGAAGDVKLQGFMRNKAPLDLTAFASFFCLELQQFAGARVLDVGSWAGVTTYTLLALNVSHVTSVEEVRKYARVTEFVAHAYSLPVRVVSASVYDLEELERTSPERYDIVYFLGVLYHLSDPILALRILYNRLRLGGMLMLETLGTEMERTMYYDRISAETHNYFVVSGMVLRHMLNDVGFDNVHWGLTNRPWFDSRIYAIAFKRSRKRMKQAGLARRDVC